jgi:hypothetical protein
MLCLFLCQIVRRGESKDQISFAFGMMTRRDGWADGMSDRKPYSSSP